MLNNASLNDVKELLRAEMRADKAELKAGINHVSKKMDGHLTMVLGKTNELERRRH